jgi:LysR family transcriptional regulator (chromosome initiation inhibitor)
MPSNIGFQGLILQGGAFGMVSRNLAEPHLKNGELVDLAPANPCACPTITSAGACRALYRNASATS